MYISSMEVDGFRSLSHVKISDMKPLTLFFGKNGAGKSSILAFLQNVFCEKEQLEELPGEPTVKLPFYRGKISNFTNNYKDNKPSMIKFDITITMTKTELNSVWPEYIKEKIPVLKKNVPEDRVKMKIAGTFNPIHKDPNSAMFVLDKVDISGYMIYDESKKPGMWLPNASSTINQAKRENLGESLLTNFTECFSNIGVARFLRKEAMTNLNEQGEILKGKDNVIEFKTRLLRAKQSRKQNEQDRYRRIRDIFSKMTPWGEMDFAQSELDSNDLEVMSWDKDSLWLPISLRGAGAEQLLVIISEVIMRNKKIIGIEELESNLDEETQGHIIDLLRKIIQEKQDSVGQIIVTAHSCFYGWDLPAHEKKYVIRKEDGSTDVEPWSATATASLFRYHLDAGTVRQRKKKQKGQ